MNTPNELVAPLPSAESLYDAIEQVLMHHHIHTWVDAEDEPLALVDHLCRCDASDISSGRDEIRLICDAIYNEVLTAERASPQAVPADSPAMPANWWVSVHADGDTLVTLGREFMSGDRAIEAPDERTIIGAAKHLLAFVGYGLPPSNFNPDEEAPQAAQPPALPEREALLDFAEHGLRFDLNPTHEMAADWITNETFWLGYVKRMDESIRDRARAALSQERPNASVEPKEGNTNV